MSGAKVLKIKLNFLIKKETNTDSQGFVFPAGLKVTGRSKRLLYTAFSLYFFAVCSVIKKAQ